MPLIGKRRRNSKACVSASKKGFGAYCYAYCNTTDHFVETFQCPVYCCGNELNKYCCRKYFKAFGDYEGYSNTGCASSMQYLTWIWIALGVIIGLILVSLLSALCMALVNYKKNGKVTTTTTVSSGALSNRTPNLPQNRPAAASPPAGEISTIAYVEECPRYSPRYSNTYHDAFSTEPPKPPPYAEVADLPRYSSLGHYPDETFQSPPSYALNNQEQPVILDNRGNASRQGNSRASNTSRPTSTRSSVIHVAPAADRNDTS
ncbi:uncharacterized protein LOC135498191 isoform X2 [Lineus longissimus]|uniref:uncharacterized protein LOC135498191 isoform X2 n=1 Tax=Lineus longissimus TaxID=88925 RepID=UPI00315C605B